MEGSSHHGRIRFLRFLGKGRKTFRFTCHLFRARTPREGAYQDPPGQELGAVLFGLFEGPLQGCTVAHKDQLQERGHLKEEEGTANKIGTVIYHLF